jgi:hypothetical protein
MKTRTAKARLPIQNSSGSVSAITRQTCAPVGKLVERLFQVAERDHGEVHGLRKTGEGDDLLGRLFERLDGLLHHLAGSVEPEAVERGQGAAAAGGGSEEARRVIGHCKEPTRA